MRNKLLATVAMTALIGCTSFAVAQNAGTQGGTMQPPGAQQQHQMGGPSGGSAQNEATPSKPTPKGEQGKSFSQENKKGEQGKSLSQENKSQPGAQGSATAPKGEQGKTFSQEERNKSAQEERNKSGAQEQRGSPNQRGAQEQRGKEEQRGAQMQREERGAQDKDRTQERMGQDQDRGKAQQGGGVTTGQSQQGGGVTTGQSQQGGGITTGQSSRTSVQLSEEQRVKIKDVIVRDRNVARVNSVNFSVSVGAKVPRDVHITVLPPEVVRIVPQFRGYDYVLVGDQLLIIDPDTMEIVAILPA
jgi:uncharacterized protein DUF1236